MSSLSPVSVYFKKAMTEQTKTYLVYPDWTITQFQAAIRPLISIDFGIGMEDFELVPTGQELSENAAPIHWINDIKLYEIWTKQLCVGFYIRC